MEALKIEKYHIRQFTAHNVAQYKALRLEALQTEPGMFSNSYATEAAFPDTQWLARVTACNSACFGLYCNEELIGITGIVIKEKMDEAYMTQSYIRKAYRGIGLSKLLYKARIVWAHERNIKRLVIGHRESNMVSKAANQAFAFRYISREPCTWPDGGTEDMLYYALELPE